MPSSPEIEDQQKKLVAEAIQKLQDRLHWEEIATAFFGNQWKECLEELEEE